MAEELLRSFENKKRRVGNVMYNYDFTALLQIQTPKKSPPNSPSAPVRAAKAQTSRVAVSILVVEMTQMLKMMKTFHRGKHTTYK